MRTALPPWGFDPSLQRWVDRGAAAAAAPRAAVTLATFNVWFEEHEFDARGAAMLGLLRTSGADVIALQEVTAPFLERMLREDWVRREFTVSDATASTIPDYGVILLSRLPVRAFEVHDLPTTMSRTLLVARVATGSRDLTVGGVHLESIPEFAPYREAQLREIFRILEPAENAVLMGDFNFCSTWEENANLDDRYADLWPLLHPDDPGWTVDGESNAMRRALGKSAKRVRFDRILARSAGGALKLRSIGLLGTEPISPDRPDLLPSDHFGLAATLEIGGPPEPAALA